jgi:hypothetical protein
MAIKVDWAFSYDPNGEIRFGDCSFITCAENDPHRMRKVDEEEVLEVLEKQRKAQKERR